MSFARLTRWGALRSVNPVGRLTIVVIAASAALLPSETLQAVAGEGTLRSQPSYENQRLEQLYRQDIDLISRNWRVISARQA